MEPLPAPSLLSSVLIPTHQQQQLLQQSEAELHHHLLNISDSTNVNSQQFIYHALSSTPENRHRRSLADDIENSFRRHLMKRRLLVKRNNFPNNQLSKSSDEDDSNEIEMDENDDFIKTEDEDQEEKENEKNHENTNNNDRLDDDDNESDSEKTMKMYVPYWDAYDTVNQLFLEMSKY